MMRIAWVLGSLLLATPGAVAAQGTAPVGRWELTLQVGVHADRLERPERMTSSPAVGTQAFTARGEAPAAGVRATRWLGAHLGLNAGATISRNTSWQGVSAQGSTTPTKLTLFSSLAPVLRLFDPAGDFLLQLGAGPALVTHAGTGESLLTRGTDMGAAGMAEASVRMSHRFRVVLGAQNYRFTSSFVDGGYQRSDGSYMFPAASVRRSDWVIQTGLRLSF